MIDLRGVVVVDGGGCVKQHRQQVLLHVANVNENVRKARDRVIQVGCENGFEVIPKRWSSNYKGIDDLLLSFIERRRITDSIFGRL